MTTKLAICAIIVFFLSISIAYEIMYTEYGGKITIYNAYLPIDMDPVWHIKNDELDMDKLLYDTLCRIDEAGNISLMLLKNASMEGNVWHFELYPNIYFAHKAALSSYDVGNSLMHIKDSPNPYSIMFKDIKSISELNALNLSVELNQPDALFLQKLCHPSASVVRRWKNMKGEEEIMGTGPFRIKENKLPESITLQANEFYYKGKPFLNEITFISSTKVNPMFYFKSGAVHLLSLWGNRLTAMNEIIASSIILEAKPPVHLFLLLNPQSNPTSDLKFRNWFERKINQAEILQSLFNNRGQVIKNLFSGTPKEKNHSAVKANHTGEISILALKRDLLSSLIAERIQAILIAEGFKTKIDYEDEKQYLAQQQKGKFHMLVGMNASYFKNAELNTMFFSSNYSYFSDYLMREEHSEPGNIEGELLNESILIPLVSLKREYVASDKIHFYMSSFNSFDELQNAWFF